MEKRIMISFADSKLKPTLKQINKEALQSGFFDEVHTYNERTFDSGYWKKYRKWYESNPRGFGYWCWKPYIIWRTMQDYPDAIVVYADAGCKLQAGEEWEDWFKDMEQYDTLLTAYRTDYDYGWVYDGKHVGVECERWIKKDLFQLSNRLQSRLTLSNS